MITILWNGMMKGGSNEAATYNYKTKLFENDESST